MTMIPAAGAPAFDEPRWQRDQRAREAELFRLMTGWLADQPLTPILRARLKRRVLRDGGTGRTDCPSLYALRLAEAFGAPPRQRDRVGIAATLFWAAADVADDVDDHEPAPEGQAATANDACALLFLAQRALLEISPASAHLGCEYGLRMSNGQALDLASTDRPVGPDLDAVVRDKAGAELAFFFRLAADAARIDSPRVDELGQAFGYALQVFSDVADLYLKPVSPDFVAGKWTWPLLHFRKRADPSLALEAFPRDWPDVLMRARYEAAPGSRLALERCGDRLLETWRRARPLCEEPAPFEDAVSWLFATLGAIHEALGDLGEAPPPPRRVEPAQALERAAAFLRSHDVAEEHRWGLFGQPYVKGGIYPLVFKAAALRETGNPWVECLDRLLAMRDDDGWRYYPGHRSIPPDADDTALILGYFGEHLPERIREVSGRQLIDNFEGAGIHTWMGPFSTDIAWEGDDCLATLSNACWALVRAGRGDGVPLAVWERLVEAAAGDRCESPFYPPSLTRMFLHRAVAAAAAYGMINLDDALRARQALKQYLASVERLAGNFGDTPQETAAAVLAATSWGLPLQRAGLQTWLCERQDADGSWPGEPFTRAPGVNLRPRVWGAAATTTCWVMLALRALQAG